MATASLQGPLLVQSGRLDARAGSAIDGWLTPAMGDAREHAVGVSVGRRRPGHRDALADLFAHEREVERVVGVLRQRVLEERRSIGVVARQRGSHVPWRAAAEVGASSLSGRSRRRTAQSRETYVQFELNLLQLAKVPGGPA